MYNSNMFKYLSLSLLMCPLFSLAMEPENHAAGAMLLSIANQSDQTINAFVSTTHVNQLRDQMMVQPYEDKDEVIRKTDRAVVCTQLGMFTLAPDNVDRPMSLVLSHHTIGQGGQILVVQEIPYYQINNITMIVNPNGSVAITQADAAYAFEKMNAILADGPQIVKVPHASIATCNLDTQIRQFINGSWVQYYCRASIIFDQEPTQQFMNNFIEFLNYHLPSPINHGGARCMDPVLINKSGAYIHINAPLLLTREFLQCILNYANEHFAHQQ